MLGFVGFSGFSPDLVLGGRISGGRERKSWKREGKRRRSHDAVRRI
jgi:hypothetical protein